MSQGPVKLAYAVIERGNQRKPFWHRIGAVFENKDGSETLVLDSLPLTSRLQLRVPNQDEGADAADRDR